MYDPTSSDPIADFQANSDAPGNGSHGAQGEDHPKVRDRWLGALCYLSVFVFVPLFARHKSSFLKRHCSQGFSLFFVEVIAVLFLWGVETTLGRIPILGFLINIILQLGAILAFLILSVIGFIKALSGESWRIPGLDELADRVPID